MDGEDKICPRPTVMPIGNFNESLIEKLVTRMNEVMKSVECYIKG